MTLAVEEMRGLEEAVQKAAAGEEMLVTRAGRTIARLVPVDQNERAENLRELRQLMEKGFDLGGLRIDRDELYVRVR